MPRPQLRPGVHWDTHATVTTADGAEVGWAVLPAEGNDAAEAPTVVLLSGFLCADTWWHFLAPALSEAGLRVIIPRYRGIAGSGSPTRPASSSMSIERFAEDVLDVLHAAGVRKVALVGHSMGGQVMVEVARRIGDRVWAMAAVTATYRSPSLDLYGAGRLVDPLAGVVAGTLDRIGDPLATHVYRAVWRTLPLVPAMRAVRAFGRHTPADLLRSYGDHGASLTGPQFTGTLAAMVRHRPDVAVLEALDIPTAVIAGEHDPLTPVAVAREMVDHLPRATLHVVADTTHAAILEAPTEVNRLVGDHLAAHTPAAAK